MIGLEDLIIVSLYDEEGVDGLKTLLKIWLRNEKSFVLEVNI